jgi:DNA invertase Pin-like site-specific DNA recombinase
MAADIPSLTSGSSTDWLRTLRNLITLVNNLKQRGVQFRSLTQELNHAHAGGMSIFHIFAVLAEFERG